MNEPLHHLSPTQIQLFEDCARKWWFRHVLKLEIPVSKSQALGNEVHTQLEHYLKTGQDVLGEIAAPGRQFLPTHGSDLKVEWGFDNRPRGKEKGSFQYQNSLLKLDNVPIEGYVDVLNFRDSALPVVIDHKTTSAIDKWALTAEELHSNTQAILYGKLALTLIPDAQRVKVRFLYFQTRGARKAEPRDVVLTRTDVDVGVVAREMHIPALRKIALETNFEVVHPNYESCHLYNGCPYLNRCFATKGSKFLSKLLDASRATKKTEESVADKNTGQPSFNARERSREYTGEETRTQQTKKQGAHASLARGESRGSTSARPEMVQRESKENFRKREETIRLEPREDPRIRPEMGRGESGKNTTEREEHAEKENGFRVLTEEQALHGLSAAFTSLSNVVRSSSGDTETLRRGSLVKQVQPENFIARDREMRSGLSQLPRSSDVGSKEEKMSLVSKIAQKNAAPDGAFVNDGPGWVDTACSTCGEIVGKRPPGSKIYFHEGCKKAPTEEQPLHMNATISPPDVPKSNPVVETAETSTNGLVKRRRGRPTKAEVETPAAPQQAATPTKTSAPPKIKGLRLFVNTIPLNEPYQSLDGYVADKAAECAAGLNVLDVRLYEYGKGPGALAAVVRASPPTPGTWVLLAPYGTLSQTIAEALVSLAEFSYIGVRS